MTLDIPLAFFAESRDEAEAQALAWAEREPHVELVSLDDAKEVKPGHWHVFITVQPKVALGQTIGLGL